jgi:hypothetical protein
MKHNPIFFVILNKRDKLNALKGNLYSEEEKKGKWHKANFKLIKNL